MKKLLAVLFATIITISLAACGSQPNETQDQLEPTSKEAVEISQVTPMVINSEPFCVEPSECDTEGYRQLICDATSDYTFKAVNNGDTEVTWTIYVMDEAFDDATKYIAQCESPALEGDGEVTIQEGQYIYVYCSANGFTTDGDLPEDAYLEINYK